MPAGRPTVYTPELIEKARAYRDNLPEDETIHSVEGLAIYLDITRKTIYEWLKDDDKSEFSDIVNGILARQGKTLINKGLKGEYTPAIAKVMLTKHGYREGIDQTTNDKDLPQPILGNVPNNNGDQEDTILNKKD